MKTTITILFYLKRAKVNPKGLVPIFQRITVNGKRIDKSTGKYIDPLKWSVEGAKMKGTSEEARTVNSHLDVLKAKVLDAEKELTGNALNEFLLKKLGKTWDNVPEAVATFYDIDSESVKAFIKDAQKSGRMPDVSDLSIEELFEKLEKFMSGKPVAEQEIGFALLQEVVAYAETSMSRRKFLLHYFGEEFDDVDGEGADMDDNVRNPKSKVEAQDQVVTLLKVVRDTKQLFKSKEVIFALVGKINAIIKAQRIDTQSYFGSGSKYDEKYWMALIRQVLVDGLLTKDIETYGVLKLSEKGEAFIKKPTSFMMSEDHEYNEEEDDAIVTAAKSSGTADEALMSMLRDLRKKVAKKLGIPPFVVFQDPSLEDMALKYPISIDELSNVHGVGEGKAKKYGKEFVELIARYVEDNDIIRPDDLVVKSTGANSGLKLYIIQNVDRKLALDDIAKAKGLDMDGLLKEMEQIVYSGTKLNINYWIDDILDEDQQEEIHDYFMDSESDNIKDALKEFDGDYDIEELRLMRIKFISEVAN